MAKKKVLVTVPNGEQWIHKETALFLLKLQQDKRYKLKIDLPTYRPLANNQHHIIKEFILGNYDYWLSCDADVAPIKNPLDLIKLDKDIIGLPAPLWRLKNPLDTYQDKSHPVYWGVYSYNESRDEYKILSKEKGLQKVDAVSGACFIIARRVFNNNRLRSKGWWRRLNKDGTVFMGNDLSFCWRARDEGWEVWVHWDYPVRHFREVELNKIMDIFMI